MNKYFVTKDEVGFNVTEEAWDSIGGNHYNNVASEFDTKDQAQEHADKLNVRLLDAKIAVEKHGWVWENMHGIREVLVAPEGDERRYWTAIWDKNGIPHFLPKYSQE